MAILAIPLLMLFIGVKMPKANVFERRTLATKINLHETSITKLPQEYENYLSDNLPFRTQFISKYMWIWETGISSFIRNYVKGRKNHYFPNFKAAPTVNRHLGFNQLPIKKLYLIRTVIAGRQVFWQSHDADYLFMLLPDKATLYPEYLPSWIQDKHSWYDQMNGILKNTRINYLDTKDVFEKHKNPKTPFYNMAYDIVHWNGNALDLMYKVISKKFEGNAYYQQIDDSKFAYTIQSEKKSAGFYGREFVPWIKLEKKALRVQKNNYKGNSRYPWFSCDIIINDNLKRGTLLFATDSYFKSTHQDTFKGANGNIFPIVHNVRKFINVHYAENFSIIKDIAQTEHPNIVIEASAERAGHNITNTNFPRLLIAGEKLLNESQLIINPNLFTPSSKHSNCLLKPTANSLEIVAKSDDPILHLPTQRTNKDGRVVVMTKLHSPVNTVSQLFYAQGNKQFRAKRMVSQKIKKGINYLHLPVYAQPNKKIRLRFDPGAKKAKYTVLPMPETKEMFEDKL
jgi:acetyltransferase AlgX (SGNH hydrolase-like protein)